MTPIKSAQALVVHKGKLLMLLRDDIPTIPEPNKWSLVGGRIEEGETPENAIQREIKEEILIEPASITYLGTLSIQDESKHAIYLTELSDDEANRVSLGDEGQELKYYSADELEDVDMTHHLKKYFSMYGDYFCQWLDKGGKLDPEKLGLN